MNDHFLPPSSPSTPQMTRMELPIHRSASQTPAPSIYSNSSDDSGKDLFPQLNLSDDYQFPLRENTPVPTPISTPFFTHQSTPSHQTSSHGGLSDIDFTPPSSQPSTSKSTQSGASTPLPAPMNAPYLSLEPIHEDHFNVLRPQSSVTHASHPQSMFSYPISLSSSNPVLTRLLDPSLTILNPHILIARPKIFVTINDGDNKSQVGRPRTVSSTSSLSQSTLSSKQSQQMLFLRLVKRFKTPPLPIRITPNLSSFKIGRAHV